MGRLAECERGLGLTYKRNKKNPIRPDLEARKRNTGHPFIDLDTVAVQRPSLLG